MIGLFINKMFTLNNMTNNLQQTQQDYAIFLPSISSFYNKIIQRRLSGQGVSDQRIPKQFEKDLEGLKFLKPDAYFHYPWALYSAGHAERDINKTVNIDVLAHDRDRTKTFLLGDSAGYQIGTGVIKLDWPNFYNTSTDNLRQQILDWLELTCDYSMLLDVPTWATEPQYRTRTGLNNWQECLQATLHNNDYFIRNRKYKTKFLNVLQGQDQASADIWYDAVKHLPVEGWAFGDSTALNLSLFVKRLIMMRDEHLLDPGRDVVHILGNGRLDWSVVLTHLQRLLRKQVNPNLLFTYDASTPFYCVSKGQVYTQTSLNKKRWGVTLQRGPDRYDLVGSTRPFPWTSSIGSRLTLGDICTQPPGSVTSKGKPMRSSWDSLSYALLQAHNVEQQIIATQQANQVFDMEHQPVDCVNYMLMPKMKPINEHIPNYIMFTVEALTQIFTSETPMTLLEQYKPILDDFLLRDEQTNNFADLFS
jgi:hypothetical protein